MPCNSFPKVIVPSQERAPLVHSVCLYRQIIRQIMKQSSCRPRDNTKRPRPSTVGCLLSHGQQGRKKKRDIQRHLEVAASGRYDETTRSQPYLIINFEPYPLSVQWSELASLGIPGTFTPRLIALSS